nr:YetF domain-containing protein [Acidobacterium sp. S8]
MDGTPLVLLKNGEWQTEIMKGMRLSPDDVMAVGRTKNLKSIHEIKYAILERNGAISIIHND